MLNAQDHVKFSMVESVSGAARERVNTSARRTEFTITPVRTHPRLLEHTPLCVEWPSARHYSDLQRTMPIFIDFLRRSLRWVVTNINPLQVVSLHLFFFIYSSTKFPGGMEAALLRMAIPANGGAIFERRWIDDRGNPSMYRLVTWVGQPPVAEGPGNRGENQA